MCVIKKYLLLHPLSKRNGCSERFWQLHFFIFRILPGGRFLYRRLLKKKFEKSGEKIWKGRENDIIIYSTVRTRDSIGFQKEKERVNVAFSRAKKLLIVCGDKNFFYNFDDQDNKFVEIIDYISEGEECEIIQCDGGKLFERESNS